LGMCLIRSLIGGAAYEILARRQPGNRGIEQIVGRERREREMQG